MLYILITFLILIEMLKVLYFYVEIKYASYFNTNVISNRSFADIQTINKNYQTCEGKNLKIRKITCFKLNVFKYNHIALISLSDLFAL